MTDYEQALRWLYSLRPRGIRLGTERIEQALRLRGNKEQRFRSVHVAGTNGKGSVCAMLGSVLREQGSAVGVFTSPHLHSVCERINIGGAPIRKGELVDRVREIRAWLSGKTRPVLTFFEVMAVLAFETFADAGCEMAVIETGLGGRLDATNVIQPIVAVITRIRRDHERWLGNSLKDIATEKAGIIKSGSTLCVAPQLDSVTKVLRSAASERGVSSYFLGKDAEYHVTSDGVTLRVDGSQYGPYQPPLPGRHQQANTALVVAAVHCLKRTGVLIEETAIVQGLEKTHWPARLEWIQGAPSFVFDAAHNLDGCIALADYLGSIKHKRSKLVLIFSSLKDKPWNKMFASLAPYVDQTISYVPDLERAVDGQQLAMTIGATQARSPQQAIELAKAAAGNSGLVVVAGSIFAVAEIRAALLDLEQDPPVAL